MWDYIKQWNSFLNTSLETLSCTEFAIYARLFQINNEQGRNEWFRAKYSVLAYFTGLSLKSVSTAINSLQQKGFIEVCKGKKGAPSEFKLVILYENKVENEAKNFRQIGNEKETNRKRKGNEFFDEQNTDEPNNEAACEEKNTSKNDDFPTKDFYIKDKVKDKVKVKDINTPLPPKRGDVDIFAKAAAGNIELLQAFDDFAEFRKSIKKPLTDKAKTLLVKRLEELAKTSAEKVQILEQSILHGWQSVYPLKSEERKEPRNNSPIEIGKRAMAMLDELNAKEEMLNSG